MRELWYFYLNGCPYCRRADEFLASLIAENTAYDQIPIRRIEERKEAALAKQYDYYYVPAFFIGDKKIHEGVATRENIKAVLDAAREE